MKSKVELSWMMNLFLLKIKIMSIGRKQLKKETTQLNAERKLELMKLRKFGMAIKKKVN